MFFFEECLSNFKFLQREDAEEIHWPTNIPIEDCRKILSHSPGLLRFLQTLVIFNPECLMWSPIFSIRVILDLPWDDLRKSICLLRSFIGEDTVKFGQLWTFMANRSYCQDLYPGPEISTNLARGCIRVMKAVETGDLPKEFWTRPEWGRHVRSSPHCPELLREICSLVPPFHITGVLMFTDPTDFHDVLQWLKVSGFPRIGM
ncbi:hypothetical protein B0H10DRAFT_2093360 [Mycena sp. CBHHK59/15]|nr:hypothetical protein B0H10DRAFT_2093360 [Mycena sp. CBHHK59/15]